MYANDRGKTISYQHIAEKLFLTLRYLAWATWNALKRNNALFPKGLPSTQAETPRYSYNTRVVTEKRLTACRTTTSRYLHAIYLWYGASRLKND